MVVSAAVATAAATAGRSSLPPALLRGAVAAVTRHSTAAARLSSLSSSASSSSAGAARSGAYGSSRIPVRREVTKEERAALRAARRERAAQAMEASQTSVGGGASPSAAAAGGAKSSSSGVRGLARNARILYGAGVGVPVALLAWGIYDENSPPAKIADAIGLTARIRGVTDEFAKPAREKLLPDWSQMPNVPHDIPVPHTLVLDLENTLVSSTWDRKYGWRHAKRPGVDKFLHEMAQYYEIVLYSPTSEGIAIPVVESLDKTGCIMHKLYRDATYYINGVHVKDLNSLNRNTNRMVLLDDDPQAAQLNPENLIRVKPYTDPNNREDRTLSRITPLLIEIAREGYNDIPAVLRQFEGMDADEIADEHERRIAEMRESRERRAHRGLGAFAVSGGAHLPPPELSPEPERTTGAPSPPPQLSSKDIVGAAPDTGKNGGGVIGWFNRRQKEKEEEQMRKMEKWNEHMVKKQKAREEKAHAGA